MGMVLVVALKVEGKEGPACHKARVAYDQEYDKMLKAKESMWECFKIYQTPLSKLHHDEASKSSKDNSLVNNPCQRNKEALDKAQVKTQQMDARMQKVCLHLSAAH